MLDTRYEALREAEKARAEKACTGALGYNTTGPSPCDEPRRADLRERIHMQRCRAEGEVERAMALAELEHLLDNNPDVARILDLVDLVKR
jgi:hypothetical protein